MSAGLTDLDRLVAAKENVRGFWDANPCNNEFGERADGLRQYFDENEEIRYANEPEIFEFAQFTRFNGKKILEVGVGMGCDFTQWVRSGAEAHGVDLTDAGIKNTAERLQTYGLKAASLRTGDAEALPFSDNTFDLVYSWGVIHHSPNTERALAELSRVCKRGGMVKFMIYNKWSAVSIMYWVLFAIRRCNPFLSLRRVFAEHIESPGTKVYSLSETYRMVGKVGAKDVRIRCYRPYFTLLYRYPRWSRPIIRSIGRVLVTAMGGEAKAGYFLTVQFRKAD